MHKEDLYRTITSTIDAPRSILVEYVRLVASEAKKMPTNDLYARSGGSQFREPQKQGERLAANAFHALVMQESLTDDLENVCSILQDLTSNTDDEKLWDEFFTVVSALH
jgi:hypothetical protein